MSYGIQLFGADGQLELDVGDLAARRAGGFALSGYGGVVGFPGITPSSGAAVIVGPGIGEGFLSTLTTKVEHGAVSWESGMDITGKGYAIEVYLIR